MRRHCQAVALLLVLLVPRPAGAAGVAQEQRGSLRGRHLLEGCTADWCRHRIVTGSNDGLVHLWALTSKAATSTSLSGQRGSDVHSVAAHPMRDKVVSGSSDATVRYWDLTNDQSQALVLEGHHSRDEVLAVAAFPPKKRADSFRQGAAVRVLEDFKSIRGEQASTFRRGLTVRVNTAFKPGTSQVVLRTGQTGTVQHVDTAGRADIDFSEQNVRVWLQQADFGMVEVVDEPWDVVLKAGWTGIVTRVDSDEVLVDLGTRHPLRQFVQKADLNKMELVEETRAVSGATDGRVIVWNTITGSILHDFAGHGGTVYCVDVFPAGDAVVSGSSDGIFIWSLVGEGHEKLIAYSDQGGRPSGTVRSVAVFPGGDHLVTGHITGKVRVWSRIASGWRDEVYNRQGFSAGMVSVVVFPDGDRIAGGDADGRVQVWDVPTGVVRFNRKASTYSIYLAVFPLGDALVSGSSLGHLDVWNPESGEVMDSFGCDPGCDGNESGNQCQGQCNPINSVAILAAPPARMMQQAVVTTCGGTAGGAQCHFPFTYEGVDHNNCIDANVAFTDSNQLWCYTDSERTAWGYCECATPAPTPRPTLQPTPVPATNSPDHDHDHEVTEPQNSTSLTVVVAPNHTYEVDSQVSYPPSEPASNTASVVLLVLILITLALVVACMSFAIQKGYILGGQDGGPVDKPTAPSPESTPSPPQPPTQTVHVNFQDGPTSQANYPIELRFANVSLSAVDQSNFITQLCEQFKQLDMTQSEVDQLTIILRGGSIIAGISGESSALAKLGAKLAATPVTVDGTTATLLINTVTTQAEQVAPPAVWKDFSNNLKSTKEKRVKGSGVKTKDKTKASTSRNTRGWKLQANVDLSGKYISSSNQAWVFCQQGQFGKAFDIRGGIWCFSVTGNRITMISGPQVGHGTISVNGGHRSIAWSSDDAVFTEDKAYSAHPDDCPEDWAPRLANLEKDFPKIPRHVLLAALKQQGGHAGMAKIDLSDHEVHPDISGEYMSDSGELWVLIRNRDNCAGRFGTAVDNMGGIWSYCVSGDNLSLVGGKQHELFEGSIQGSSGARKLCWPTGSVWMQRQAPAATPVEAAFNGLDANHDGYISTMEWNRGVQASAGVAGAATKAAINNSLDVNNDGYISRTEWNRGVQASR